MKNLISLKSFTVIFLIAFLTISCEEPKTLNSIPKKFLGKWTETSDEILQQQEEPKTLIINSNNVKIVNIDYVDEKVEENNKVNLIKQTSKNRIDITCLKGRILTTEITFILKDGILHASEFLHSGTTDSDGGVYGKSYDIGKFYRK